MLKQVQRQVMRRIRTDLPLAFQEVCSAQVCEHIIQLPEYQKASSLALYVAVEREISLQALWQHALDAGKCCYFPVMQADGSLQFLPAAMHTPFRDNRLGIPEPAVHELSILDIDLFCVPLLAFDAYGHRLGQGAGCYDKTLARVSEPFCMGVGYAFQELSLVLPDETDISMQMIVTERGVRRI